MDGIKKVAATNSFNSQQFWQKRSSFFYFLAILMVFVFIATAFPGALFVSWDANTETDLAGYKIYYGTQSATYNSSVDVGNTTSYILDNLVEGQTYYIVLTAYDQSGNESVPSNEVSAVVTGPEVYLKLTDQGLSLQWTPYDGADSYEIYKDSQPYFSPTTPVASVTGNSYTDAAFEQVANTGSYYIIKALANGQELYTFDTVGAYTIPIQKGRNLISLPFVPSDSTLNGAFGDQLTGGSQGVTAAKVMIWNGNGYDVAWKVDGTGTSYDGKWMNEAGNAISTMHVKPDMSFWVVVRPSHTDSLLTLNGKISTDSNRVITLTKGANFIGTCYPVEVSLDSSELYKDHVVIGSSSAAGADKIMHWIGSGNNYEAAWLVDGTGTTYDGKWMNEKGTGLSTISFKPGHGYILWIKNDNPNKIWTYPNPNL